jgi:hypothetical protein
MGELGPLPRTGQKKGTTRAGSEFAYTVFVESDILQPVQKALAAHGIVIIPEVVALDRRELPADRPDRSPQRLVDLMVRFTICDADSGEQLIGQAPGSAEERGDGTGVAKAFGDCNKNFLRKLFEIAAEESGKARVQQSRPPAPQPAANPATSSPNGTAVAVITEPQRKRLWALCKEHEVEADRLKDFLFQKFAFAHSKDIRRDCYELVCAWIVAGGK